MRCHVGVGRSIDYKLKSIMNGRDYKEKSTKQKDAVEGLF